MRKVQIALVALLVSAGAVRAGIEVLGIEVLGIEVLGIEVLADGIEVLSVTSPVPAEAEMVATMFDGQEWLEVDMAPIDGLGMSTVKFPELIANCCRLEVRRGIEVLAISTWNGSDWE
jgi:hypothetical protein